MVFKDADFKTFYPLKELYDAADTEQYCPERDFSEFQSLSLNEISSESQAIDFAYLISLIRNFTGENELYLTIRGRHGSEKFSFNIPNVKQPVNVSGVQIEIDAGFESPSSDLFWKPAWRSSAMYLAETELSLSSISSSRSKSLRPIWCRLAIYFAETP
jgi:hypothetical protein